MLVLRRLDGMIVPVEVANHKGASALAIMGLRLVRLKVSTRLQGLYGLDVRRVDVRSGVSWTRMT